MRTEPPVGSLMDRNLRRRLARRGRRMLAALGLDGVEVSLLLATNETVAQLNAEWRSKKGATDVLSFPLADADEIAAWTDAEGPLDHQPDRLLGDLVVAVPLVKRRSPRPSAFEKDLTTLLAHGLLHLVGHVHARAADRRRMLSLQDNLVRIATGRGAVQTLQ